MLIKKPIGPTPLFLYRKSGLLDYIRVYYSLLEFNSGKFKLYHYPEFSLGFDIFLLKIPM